MGKPELNLVRFNLMMEESFHRQLRDRCYNTGIKMADFVRQAIREKLAPKDLFKSVDEKSLEKRLVFSESDRGLLSKIGGGNE